MTAEEKAQMQRWVNTWKRAGPLLEKIREEEVRAERTPAAFEAFAGLALLAIRDSPPEPGSGLVEQQRWFRKAAAREVGQGE